MLGKDDILFQQAVHVLKRGERERARLLMRQILLDNPRYAHAWLWMSALVDDIKQRRECLERTLEIDPDNTSAKKGLEILSLQEFVATMPSTSDSYPASLPPLPQARKLGEYLVEHGIIVKEQLEKALQEQQRLMSEFHGTRFPLGDTLVKLNMLTPAKLATVLVEQQQEKIGPLQKRPEYLGEYMISKRVITQEQLKEILRVQIQLRQKGQNMLLGELLVRSGYVTKEALESVLQQQLDDIFNRFDDKEE
jgi:hypothetical protein